MPRYTWRESATRISTGQRRASARASSVLPEAVGPTTPRMGGGRVLHLDQALHLLDVGRPAGGGIGGDDHRIEGDHALGHREASRQMARETRQDGLEAEPDDR